MSSPDAHTMAQQLADAEPVMPTEEDMVLDDAAGMFLIQPENAAKMNYIIDICGQAADSSDMSLFGMALSGLMVFAFNLGRKYESGK